ncbi:MAG: C25 family cysteine peptidase, partial [Gemmataceae bacterium]
MMHILALGLLIAAPPDKLVVLAGELPDEALIVLSSAVAARPDATLLIDSPAQKRYTDAFLAAFMPGRVLKVAKPADVAAAVRELLPDAKGSVVCPPEPRAALLRAAALAAVRKVPLRVRRGAKVPARMEADHLARLKAVETAVVVNPADPGVAVLAGWLAATRDAALLFTNDTGDDAAAAVELAAKNRPFRNLQNVILLADLKAIPVKTRPNPIPDDKDKLIEMEPLTPDGGDPYTFAVGRLFHADRAVVPLLLARQKLLAERAAAPRVLIASNPGGSLPLLETFSRSTARELTHAGYDVRPLFNAAVTERSLRAAMRDKELILWEGHHNTLVKEWGFTTWDEPIGPSFVFLQSCLALMPEKVHPLLARGAVGVVGTSTRTYSGSGGAFSLAFLDAIAYEDRTAGEALRQAKNFLAVYALLKEKRLGDEAMRLGANQRAAWSMTLWGDPTFRLPRPPEKPTEAVRHALAGSTLVVKLPATWHRPEDTPKYQVHMPPNARLAGLVRRAEERPTAVVPLVFAEVAFPKAPADATPVLRGRLPSNNWAFRYDGRRKVGYLLALPRAGDRDELRFRVEWQDAAVAKGK